MSSEDVDVNAIDERQFYLALTRSIGGFTVLVVLIITTWSAVYHVNSAKTDAKAWKARALSCERQLEREQP